MTLQHEGPRGAAAADINILALHICLVEERPFSPPAADARTNETRAFTGKRKIQEKILLHVCSLFTNENLDGCV